MKSNNYYVTIVSIIFIFPMTMASGEETNNINNNFSLLNSTNLDFATNIQYMKGHLYAAISNKEVGNDELTQTHSLRPITELYSLISQQVASVENNSLNQTLTDSLNNLTSIVFTATPTEFNNSVSHVRGLLDEALIEIIPKNEIQDLKFNTSILIKLLKTAESEYNIGIQNGSITNMTEYQDAQGFVSSSGNLLDSTITNLNATMASKFSGITDSINKLKESIDNKDDGNQISKIVKNITTSLPNILNVDEKDLAILVSTEREPSEIINNIQSQLNESLENVANGNYQKAENLAIEAYLDNFEFIEGEITNLDETIMKDTEILLREKLRFLIQEKANVEDIQKLINSINLKLNKIQNLLR